MLLLSPCAEEVVEVSVGMRHGQVLHRGLRVAVTRASICQDRNRHSHECEARAVEVGVIATTLDMPMLSS